MITAKNYLYILLLFVLSSCSAQNQNKYGLTIIDDIDTYRVIVEEDRRNTLVDLEELIPGIILDIRYATINNFTKKQIYDEAKAYLRMDAAIALKSAQEDFKKLGYGIKIYDAYRPYSATVKLFEIFPDPEFAASPKTGSLHNRGCAVDLTLVDLKSGKELTMPTEFDSFNKEAAAFFNDLPDDIIKNRSILQQVLIKHGFLIYESEWWHFNYKDHKLYSLMDISFDQLK